MKYFESLTAEAQPPQPSNSAKMTTNPPKLKLPKKAAGDKKTPVSSESAHTPWKKKILKQKG